MHPDSTHRLLRSLPWLLVCALLLYLAGPSLTRQRPGGEGKKDAPDREKGPLPTSYGKATFYRQRQMELADAYAYASDVMAHNMMEEDACEGIDAFIEKRQPHWKS